MKTFAKLSLLLCCLGGLIGSSSAISYNFKPRASPTSCMGLDSTGVGFKVAACDTTNANQKFAENLASTVLTTILTGLSAGCNSLALDAVPGNAPNGAATNLVQQSSWNPGSKTQYWIQAQAPGGNLLVSPGSVSFTNFGTGACMTSESQGAYIDTYGCAGATHQLWLVGPPNLAAQGEFTITNQQTDLLLQKKCLKITGGSPWPNTAAITATCAPTEYGQNFLVFNNTASWFKIGTSPNCLDGGGSVSNLYPYVCTPTALNHQWMRFNYPADDIQNDAYFMDLLSGLCLTWDNTSPWVRTSTCTQGAIGQRWTTAYVQ